MTAILALFWAFAWLMLGIVVVSGVWCLYRALVAMLTPPPKPVHRVQQSNVRRIDGGAR